MKAKTIEHSQKTFQANPDPLLCQAIHDLLDESKAVDIVAVDLAHKSAIADYLVIASGTSGRHLKALADKVKERLHKMGIHTVQIEGLENMDWVLVDGGNIIVHLFRPEVRNFYGLDKIWTEKSLLPKVELTEED